MKTIYIAHPIGGDVEGNLDTLLPIVKEMWTRGTHFPIVPYILPLKLGWDDDTNFLNRMRGLVVDCQFVKHADEVWLYGDRISAGMWQEISVAIALNIPVIPKTEGTRRDWENMWST